MPKPVIYQLVVRYFGNINATNERNGSLATNGCGKFADINAAALAGLKDLGVTHLWLTGCLRQATLTDYAELDMLADDPDVVKGVAGSMYAVRDYFDVCPDYASDPAERMAEFEALINRVHHAGLKVLIDFVPNHVARGYHSVIEPNLDFGVGDDQTQFFTRDNHFYYLPGTQLTLTHFAAWNPPAAVFDGKFSPEDGTPGHTPKVTGDNCAHPNPSPDNWYETIKLNYGFNFRDGVKDLHPQPALWDVMDRILAHWQGKGVDGFRCDMAHLIPGEAWSYLIYKARDRDPDCLLLAEAYPGGGNDVPIHNLDDLISEGFNAVYHSDAYNALKRIYRGQGNQDGYDATVTALSLTQRDSRLGYLENHDERRIASTVERDAHQGESGFGSLEAGYQLAPLQCLFGRGPILVLNGQEVGEPGRGAEGFSSGDGRTTTFDYWCMPEFAKWVNGHAYDGGGLSAEQHSLRKFYGDLLALCQDSAICGDGYWGLKYFNRASQFGDFPDDLYTFARFQTGSGKLLVVAANFRPGSDLSGPIRLPSALVAAAGLALNPTVRLILDRRGTRNDLVGTFSRASLSSDGFAAVVSNQSSHVYVAE